MIQISDRAILICIKTPQKLSGVSDRPLTITKEILPFSEFRGKCFL
jgi:hypothetical protein